MRLASVDVAADPMVMFVCEDIGHQGINVQALQAAFVPEHPSSVDVILHNRS